MCRIRILPDHIVNKIAAGEVVERPASVVKELVENSLDAGAKSISVVLKVGGKNLIKVVDDGCGMSPDDALTALEAHATSKITSEEDLDGIKSLGFRGEAIPSIASVSRMNLVTRSKNEPAAVNISLEGGRVVKVKEVGAPVGTSVEVANLFFNVPARRKFLKTTATELTHITRALTNVALSDSKLRLHVEHNGRKILHFTSASNLPERITQVLGAHIQSEMVQVDFSIDSYSIKGLALKPAYARAGKSEQIIFVNRRPVRDSMIARAAYDAYSSLIEHKRHPGWILFIEMNPKDVDVNVHPNKSEVRFANQKRIFDLVREGILTALKGADLSVKSKCFTPVAGSGKSASAKSRGPQTDIPRKRAEAVNLMVADYVRSQKKTDMQKDFSKQSPPPSPSLGSSSLSSPGKEKIPLVKPENETPVSVEKKGAVSEWVPIGQFHNSFLICQYRDELILIDQHAAHERVLFEKILRDLENRSLAVQRLLIPVPLELSPAEAFVLEEYRDCFSELGFVMDDFGKNTFMIKEVPALLGQEDIRSLVKDILAELSKVGRGFSLSGIKEKIAASTACRAAVKANQKLKMEEIRSLLDQMGKANNPYCCPHGRPCVVKYTLSTLRKDFHRT